MSTMSIDEERLAELAAYAGGERRKAGKLARLLARRGSCMAAPRPADGRPDGPTNAILPTGESNSLHEKFPQHAIGRWTYGDLTIHSWGEKATLRIGSFCSIAPGVQVFLGGEHRSDWVTTFPFSVLWGDHETHPGHPKTKGDVVIGNEVWIGNEALSCLV